MQLARQSITEYYPWLENHTTLTLSTITTDNEPYASYAPYLFWNGAPIIFVSQLAPHTAHLSANPTVSILILDESNPTNHFFKERLTLACRPELITRDNPDFTQLIEKFKERFDVNIISMLEKLNDFVFVKLQPQNGRATMGFGKAYDLYSDS